MIEFYRAGHKFARELLVGEVLQTAQAITATNFCPAKQAVVAKACKTQNSASNSPRYPATWPVDKTLLREAITSFRSNTKAFRTTQTFRNFDWHILEVPQVEDLSPNHLQVDHPSALKKRPAQPATVKVVPFRLQVSHPSNYKRPSATDELSTVPESAGKPQGARNSSEGASTQTSTTTTQAQSTSSTSQQTQSLAGPTKELSIANMTSNAPNAALLEQTKAMINKAITA